MRQIKEVLRLAWEVGLGAREVARSLAIAHPTVLRYLSRAREQGLSWPLPAELSDTALEKRLCGPPSFSPASSRPLPDCAEIHQELKRKGVTLQLLWQEYKEAHPSGYQYTQFCDYYRKFVKKLDLSLRCVHKAGERLFVDYAGQTVPVIDPLTGEIRYAQIFVAVLGASNYTYAEAAHSQNLPSWIGAHIRAFEYFQGVPSIVVPDNLRSAVTRSCRYEPEINPTYHAMAVHYGVAILPARARAPKDKSKAEVGVLIVERWILARLRNRTFFSLAELNAAILGLLRRLNDRPFKKMEGCRRRLFEALDRPALKPLPEYRYEYAEWKKARVNIDYHIEVAGHYYSVPYSLVREEVEVRITATTVECFHKGERIASHPRSTQKGKHTTQKEHRPLSHQRYLEWTPSRIIDWAARIGPATSRVIEEILNSRLHPEQGFRSSLGILRLAKSYSDGRLEAACQRAMAIRGYSYKSIASILKHGLDQRPIAAETKPRLPVEHPNIRGARYYQMELQSKEEEKCSPIPHETN
jgi:transposase